MPDRAALTDSQAAMARLDAELIALRAQLHEIEVAQKRIEDDVASIEAKRTAETKKLNSGSITAPREIQALSDEIDALSRRARALDDSELELMERGEPIAADVERLGAERAAAAAEAERLVAVIADQEKEIDDEVARVNGEREAAAADIPADLLAQYERIRTKLGGIGAARLEGDRCLGCHISLPAMEVDAVRHARPGTIVTHEECGRILVR